MTKMIRLVLVMAMLSLALIPAAQAKGGGNDVRKSGSCTTHGTWKIKLSKDDGRIETDYELDVNRAGRTWKVTLKHNGHRFFRGLRTTKAPSGSFEVRKFANNAAGTDKIVAKARNVNTGKLCKGVARI